MGGASKEGEDKWVEPQGREGGEQMGKSSHPAQPNFEALLLDLCTCTLYVYI